MTSIHRKLKLVFVAPDGDGGYVLKVMTADHEQFDMPLTAELAAELAGQCASACRDMLRQMRAKPNETGPVNTTIDKFQKTGGNSQKQRGLG